MLAPHTRLHQHNKKHPSFSKQIYAACAANGRIAYKRTTGSRAITDNDHWKSQIRHALYTGDRFVR